MARPTTSNRRRVEGVSGATTTPPTPTSQHFVVSPRPASQRMPTGRLANEGGIADSRSRAIGPKGSMILAQRRPRYVAERPAVVCGAKRRIRAQVEYSPFSLGWCSTFVYAAQPESRGDANSRYRGCVSLDPGCHAWRSPDAAPHTRHCRKLVPPELSLIAVVCADGRSSGESRRPRSSTIGEVSGTP
jgi:hypothetical protein